MPADAHPPRARRAPPRPLVIASLVLLTLVWGSTWAAIRIGLKGIPPFTGVAVRFAIASAGLLAVAPLMGVRFGRSAAERWLWVLNAALSFCVSYGVVYWCEQWVPSGLAAILFATFPLFVAILAHFMLPGESLTRRALLGIVLGLSGVSVIFSEDFSLLGGPMVAVASAVMLVSPFVSAVSAVAIKRWGAQVHPVSISGVPMALGAVVMGILALGIERGREVSLTPVSVGALLYLAIFGSAVTFTLYYWLMTHMAASRLALIAYTTPVVAVTLGILFMNEPLTARTLAGSLLVVLGVAIAVQGRPRIVPLSEEP